MVGATRKSGSRSRADSTPSYMAMSSHFSMNRCPLSARCKTKTMAAILMPRPTTQAWPMAKVKEVQPAGPPRKATSTRVPSWLRCSTISTAWVTTRRCLRTQFRPFRRRPSQRRGHPCQAPRRSGTARRPTSAVPFSAWEIPQAFNRQLKVSNASRPRRRRSSNLTRSPTQPTSNSRRHRSST